MQINNSGYLLKSYALGLPAVQDSRLTGHSGRLTVGLCEG